MNGIAITEKDKQFIRDYYDTKSDRFIAQFLCLSQSTVFKYRQVANLGRESINYHNKNSRADAEKELNAILSLPYMAQFHNSTMQRIKVLDKIINCI